MPRLLILLLPLLLGGAIPANDPRAGNGSEAGIGQGSQVTSVTPAATGTLTVLVSGGEADGGPILLALYDSEDSFRETPVRTTGEQPSGGTAVWVIQDLPPGEYALAAFHDINDNGELDTGILGIPKEPWGFSNDARGRMGPPSWQSARIRFDPPADTVAFRVH